MAIDDPSQRPALLLCSESGRRLRSVRTGSHSRRTTGHDLTISYPTVTRNGLDRCRRLSSSDGALPQDDPRFWISKHPRSTRSGCHPLGMILLFILQEPERCFACEEHICMRPPGWHLHRVGPGNDEAACRCVFHYHDPRRGNRILAQSLDGGVNGHRVKACCLPERRERREPDQLPNEAAKTRWKDPRSSSGKPWRRLSLMWYRYSDLLRLHSLVPSVRKQPYPM